MNVRKSLTLSTIEYYMTHLSIINTIIPQPLRMTPKEIAVLAAFLSIIPSARFTSYGRKLVKESLNLSPSGLSNHTHSLILKKFLIPSPDDFNTPIDVAPNILPTTTTQEYHIRITLDPSLPEPIAQVLIPQNYEDINHDINITNGTTYQDQTKEEEYEGNNQLLEHSLHP